MHIHAILTMVAILILHTLILCGDDNIAILSQHYIATTVYALLFTRLIFHKMVRSRIFMITFCKIHKIASTRLLLENFYVQDIEFVGNSQLYFHKSLWKLFPMNKRANMVYVTGHVKINHVSTNYTWLYFNEYL